MPIIKHNKLLLGLSLTWALLICALGAWWLYLLTTFGNKLDQLLEVQYGPNIAQLVKWEGGTFIILLLLLSASIFFLHLRDLKKTKALQDFFASLTHELKTPLASIRLQAEVIRDILPNADKEKLETLTDRMMEDTSKLETQMDKILQLSRLERGGELNLQPIDLAEFLHNFSKEMRDGFQLHIENDSLASIIWGDQFALELIMKNFIENTRNHANSQEAKVHIRNNNNTITLNYSDSGVFSGDHSKLGTLFYKYNSSKGSGIGLYLIKKLALGMKGELSFQFTPTFSCSLSLRKGPHEGQA